MGNRETAANFYNQAVTAARDKSKTGFLSHAYTLFSSACMMDPTWAESFYQAGNNNCDLSQQGCATSESAIACWYRALENEPDEKLRSRILANMGWQLQVVGRTQEALESCKRAIEMDPEQWVPWVTLSLVYRDLGMPKESVEAAYKGFALETNDAVAEAQLAFALLFNGQYKEGFERYECRFRWRLHHFLHFPYPRWEGQEGKTVYVVADQGMGDTLSFSRFLEQAAKRSKFIHALVQPDLLSLLQYSLGHLDNLNLMPQPSPYPEADYWTTFISLPFALGLSDDQIKKQKHIKLPSFEAIRNWKVPDRKFHIGISWAGSPLNDIDKHRNLSPTYFFELYRVPGIQLYSLQVGDRAGDLGTAGGFPVVRDLAPYIRSVADTMEILKQLDLVICCESALAHMCALAEKECWIPYSYLGRDWRIGATGDKMLWTPKHRIFRQGQDLKWGPVFNEIADALQKRVK